jgi:hypothetical protein
VTVARKSTRKSRRAGSESGLVLIVERNLSDIRPSPLNDKLYRPISDTDPAIIELAESIRQRGLLEPIVITLDGFILSGHRRHRACRLAGLRTVPCRVSDITSTDPEFLPRLCESNRQRVKSLDELAREQILAANPEEEHRALVEHRRRQKQVDVATIPLMSAVRRARISKAKEPMLQAILTILETRRSYWPLTERQIHYALLNDPPLVHARKPDSTYRNTLACYKATCDLVTRARLEGRIPFTAIDDPTRPMEVWECYREPGSFLRAEMEQFLKGYYRDLQQSQPHHIEIVGEKSTLENILGPVASEYCIPLTIGRGYCSIPPRYHMQQRYRRSGKEKLILLALSDFDPEGEDIAHSFARSLRDDFGIDAIEPIKVALTAAQVQELRLPPLMQAKRTSSRYGNFVEQHGQDVFELEAVPPEQLQAILRQAIDGVLDVDAFNAEIDAEKRDAAHLAGLRRALRENLDEWIDDADEPEA